MSGTSQERQCPPRSCDGRCRHYTPRGIYATFDTDPSRQPHFPVTGTKTSPRRAQITRLARNALPDSARLECRPWS